MTPGEHITVPMPSEASLRETITLLAEIERGATSAGEAEAADWIAGRLRALGVETQIDVEPARASYAGVCATLCAAGAAGGALSLLGARRIGGALAALATTGLVDECSNGPRVFRRALSQAATTTNVVGIGGDTAADRTVVLLAHHDAAPTGAIFDPSFQQWLGRTFPTIVERADTALPIWWPVLGGPALVAAGSAMRRRRMVLTGVALAAGATAAFKDIARSPIVPGANDNLSAVASLIAVAASLAERPVKGIRVMFASCGAEETLQEGMRQFAPRHLAGLDREKTWVLNLDTVGSPRLSMLEGEGPIIMEDYPRKEFRDLVADTARDAGIRLRRGLRARSSTDSVIAARMGFPTATLVSIDANKALSNYHLMTDTADRVDYGTVARAATLADCVVRSLADGPHA
jgi:hypothetical protein